MKPLILTGFPHLEFAKSGMADLAIDFSFRFVWGKLPSPDELASYLGHRTPMHGNADHWSVFAMRWDKSKNRKYRDLGLVEFCLRYETVELWFDTNPNAQLTLVWLLDYFQSYPEVIDRLRLRLVDLDMISLDKLGKWKPPAVDVTESEIATARAVWQAYRNPTPEACFALLGSDLSALPLLRLALNDVLAELPSPTTGLGATEMRMLELIARGYQTPALLYHYQLRGTWIFREFEHGSLLEGLAHCPHPAVAGLDDVLRTLGPEKYNSRLEAYRRSRLSLTEFGESIVAYKGDFSWHNPIDRWWGGTHLTNDHLWRFGQVLVKPAS
jgi:hypothetical protein